MNQIVRPLLAAKIEDPKSLRFPLFLSPKIDGIRCIIHNGEARSRTGKLIRNPYVQELAKDLKKSIDFPLDGELVYDSFGTPFNKTDSEIMSFSGGANVLFEVFDTIQPLPFDQRLDNLGVLQEVLAHPKVSFVQQELVESYSEVEAKFEVYLGRGYEGIMLRKPDALYKHGRSTFKEHILLKHKLYVDDEALVTGFSPMEVFTGTASLDAFGLSKTSKAQEFRNTLDTLGAIICSWHGIEFSIGTGFSESQRKEIWDHRSSYLNSLVRFKYLPYGMLDKPRCPSFLTFVTKD